MPGTLLVYHNTAWIQRSDVRGDRGDHRHPQLGRHGACRVKPSRPSLLSCAYVVRGFSMVQESDCFWILPPHDRLSLPCSRRSSHGCSLGVWLNTRVADFTALTLCSVCAAHLVAFNAAGRQVATERGWAIVDVERMSGALAEPAVSR